ncbi:MAG TPA: hypothetical protein VGB82_16525 [Alphaproteobacteria bacterium]
MTGIDHPMLEALHAAEPDPALAAKLQLYGQFVGSWTLDIDHHPLNGPHRQAEAEWHFDWVLDGKAVQDVWIYPARHVRAGKPPEPWHCWGSTFRYYDPTIDAWHITYFDPSKAFAIRQIGRAAGPDIVQVSEDACGLMRRWRFVDITGQSFRWIGEASWDKGGSWTQEMEMRARRAQR